jgi:hypothetical protein
MVRDTKRPGVSRPWHGQKRTNYPWTLVEGAFHGRQPWKEGLKLDSLERLGKEQILLQV